MVSDEALIEVNRMLRGRSPSNVPKSIINEAIDFINANPGLRRQVEGGAPTGLSAKRLSQFKRQEAKRLGVEIKKPFVPETREFVLKREAIKKFSPKELKKIVRVPKKIPIKKKITIKTFKPKIIKKKPLIKTRARFIKKVKDISKRATKEISKSQEAIKRRQLELKTEALRKKKKTIKKEAEKVGLIAAGIIATTSKIIVSLPQLKGLVKEKVKEIKEDPKKFKENLKRIPRDIQDGFKGEAKMIKVDPTTAIAKIGKEILLIGLTTKGFKVVGKITGNTATKLNPKFKGIKENKITIPTGQKGEKVTIKIGGTVKEIQEPLKRQVKLAGKEVTGVSAQADRLVNLIRTKRIVRKPIPEEAKLNPLTKKLLNKFDEGKITKKQLITLDKRIRKETKGAGNILERSFFADPRGRFRPSRLGLDQEDASLLDILAGDITFKTNKPQILIFPKTKIEKLPKNLKDVAQKLRANKPLTESQARRLLQFQTKVTGKFKPIGALSKEPEITLAPGEIIKRVRKAGVTIIKGRKVDIVLAKVVKSKPRTKKLLKKAEKGKITNKEIKELKGRLKRETGFKQPSLSRSKKLKRRVRAPKRIPRGRPRPPKRPRPRGRPRPPKRPRPRGRPRPRKTGRGGTPPPPRPRPRPKPIPRKPFIAKIPKRKRIRKPKKIKEKQGYNVFARPTKKRKGQKKPKLIRINKKPLTKKQAKDLGSFVADKSLARTFKVKKVKGKPTGKLPRGVRSGHFSRTKKKFRTFKRVKGKRIPLKNKFIEKKGKLLDTKTEKKGIGLRRLNKQLKGSPRKTRKAAKKQPQRSTQRALKTKVTPQVRRKRTATPKQLKNLAKGRKILAANRKKK